MDGAGSGARAGAHADHSAQFPVSRPPPTILGRFDNCLVVVRRETCLTSRSTPWPRRRPVAERLTDTRRRSSSETELDPPDWAIGGSLSMRSERNRDADERCVESMLTSACADRGARPTPLRQAGAGRCLEHVRPAAVGLR